MFLVKLLIDLDWVILSAFQYLANWLQIWTGKTNMFWAMQCFVLTIVSMVSFLFYQILYEKQWYLAIFVFFFVYFMFQVATTKNVQGTERESIDKASKGYANPLKTSYIVIAVRISTDLSFFIL